MESTVCVKNEKKRKLGLGEQLLWLMKNLIVVSGTWQWGGGAMKGTK